MLILKEINFALDAVDGKFFAYPLDENACPILSNRIEITSHSRDDLSSIFWDFVANKLVQKKDKICHVCGVHFQSSKNRVFTHSDACRTKKRHIVKSLKLIGANDEDFLKEFMQHVSNLQPDDFTFSINYLFKNMPFFEVLLKRISPRDLKYLILSNQDSI